MDYNQSPEQVAVSLSCIMLLEDKTPRQAFQDFLVARMVSTIPLLLQGDLSSSLDFALIFFKYRVKGTSSVRTHISNAVKLIHNTVFQIAALFCENQPEHIGEGKFLSRTLSDLLSTPILGESSLLIIYLLIML